MVSNHSKVLAPKVIVKFSQSENNSQCLFFYLGIVALSSSEGTGSKVNGPFHSIYQMTQYSTNAICVAICHNYDRQIWIKMDKVSATTTIGKYGSKWIRVREFSNSCLD